MRSRGIKIANLLQNAFNTGKVSKHLQLGGGAAPVNPDFVSTWDTTKAGSASDTVVLPLLSSGTYNGTIDWGDGNTSVLSYANRTHVYAASGTYTITISGSDIQGWRFNSGGDKLKITDISNWGNLTLTTTAAFAGCSNFDISANDAPIISTTDLSVTFANCSSLTRGAAKFDVSGVTALGTAFANSGMFANCANYNEDLSGWDVSNVTDFRRIFLKCTSFDGNISTWDTSNGIYFVEMLYDCDAFDRSLANWDITSMSNATNFMTLATGLSTANYDATLIGWEAKMQTAWPGGAGYPYTININFGGSKYTAASAAATARASLVTNFGWTITDGGTA